MEYFREFSWSRAKGGGSSDLLCARRKMRKNDDFPTKGDVLGQSGKRRIGNTNRGEKRKKKILQVRKVDPQRRKGSLHCKKEISLHVD